MSHREEWVCCFSSSALALKNDPDMLSQEGAAHNGQSDDDVFLSCKTAQSVFLHINHPGCRTTHVCEQSDHNLRLS
ncbi:hypothetical protein, partial [Citrobacter farmeri]